jgi:lysophospholipase L1-like esterase
MRYLGILCLITIPLLAQNNTFTYLALGDSVPFGMNSALVLPYTSQTPTPSEFIGYPEVVAVIDHATDVNASCPGETSASFLTLPSVSKVPDNGCNSDHYVYPPPGSSPTLPVVMIPPFKTTYGLHTNYTEAQMDFAMSQLAANKNIKLVTLSIGANDVLLALPALEMCGTNTTCAEGVLTPVLEAYGNNLAQILGGIRSEYTGTLVLLTYYSPLSSLNTVTQALNSVMTQVAAQFPSITIADGYTAFQLASTFANNNACQAGLLIKLPPSPYDQSPCDVHPSPLGRNILAATIELAALTGQ